MSLRDSHSAVGWTPTSVPARLANHKHRPVGTAATRSRLTHRETRSRSGDEVRFSTQNPSGEQKTRFVRLTIRSESGIKRPLSSRHLPGDTFPGDTFPGSRAMLKFLFGSASSRRHRQSSMVAAQVSPLERRVLLDSVTGYGSCDPYDTSSSGSDSGSSSSSSGSPDPYADGSMSGSSSGSTSGSSSGNGSLASPSNPPPTTGSITLRPNVSSASNNLNVSKATGDDSGTPFIRTHDLFTNANFDVDLVYSGSSPKVKYTATNGDTTLSWTGLGWGQGASVPVGSGTRVRLTAELFDEYGRFVDSDTCTIGVVTFSLTGSSVQADAGVTEVMVQSEAENYLRAMAAAPIADLRSDLVRLATQLDKADPRYDLWQTQLPLNFDNMVANGLDSIDAESRDMDRSASRLGLSVPFSWTDANNNRIEGKVGASTFVLPNPQGQNGRVYDIKSGIIAKQYESGVLIRASTSRSTLENRKVLFCRTKDGISRRELTSDFNELKDSHTGSKY